MSGAGTSGDSGEQKHPLQHQWQLWYFKNDKKKEWSENLHQVSKVQTVEDFWALYNHIELASGVDAGCDYCLFKDDVKPMWEDPANRNGGRWLFQMAKRPPGGRLIDDVWLEVMLCLIGEAFGDDSDEICGAVVNIRGKMDKIAIWTANCKKAAAVQNIGRILKERTRFPGTIVYESHRDQENKHGSTTRGMYSV